MRANSLKTLSMEKYERLLPRIFPAAATFEIRDQHEKLAWSSSTADAPDSAPDVSPWKEIAASIERRELQSGDTQFRAPIRSKVSGEVARLTVGYNANDSVPLGTATDAIRQSFTVACTFLQEELDLQTECDQLAVELTEKYEELNLMYTTKDSVEYFEEGQEALVRLVRNCADYLNVGFAAMICRERGVSLHSNGSGDLIQNTDQILELISSRIYDRIESQVRSLVLNETDETERRRLVGGRTENILANPILDDQGNAIGILAVVARRDVHTFSNGDRNLLDVMAKKASRIIHTHHDSLTGLLNRGGFESSLISTLATARSKNLRHCLLHVDIDQLQVVNDLMGHQEGDGLIRRVARILQSGLRDSDILARLGGDEFGVILTNCDIEQGRNVADKIRGSVGELTVVTANRQLDVSCSIGIAPIERDTDGIVGVMASAEIACAAAKDGGRNSIEVFEDDNTSLVRRSEEIEWMGRVQQALRDDLFVPYCQPVLPLANPDAAPHYEILVRLQGDDGQILTPNHFLPAAERFQLMPMVDRWVIHNSLKMLASCWSALGNDDLVFCINLSGQSLTNNGFLAFVADEIGSSGIAPRNLCFEITETAAISKIDEAIAFMTELRDLGCSFALDDFGAGLSSFGYLKVLPVDYLKIDGSFVREVTTDVVSRSMVEAICQIGKTMGLTMIAEYVGDDETIEVLNRIGVDYAQGFHIGEPAPLADLTGKLRDATSTRSA